MKLHYLLLTLLTCVFYGCASTPFEPAATISSVAQNEGYRANNLINEKYRHDPLFITVMFSGGGSRAATFGYKVLEALHEQDDGKGGHLLDHVGLTFGVSGGSVISMYYALHGADTFPHFEDTFLRQDFQGNVIDKLFSSDYLFWLSSPEFGRGDLLARQFDEHLFHSATFGDILNQRKGPMSIITASDFTAGHRFNFIQDYFDIICLDLSKYSIARAVAASSAVPVIFTPITINNNAGNCHYQPSKLIAGAEESAQSMSEPTDLAVARKAFSDRNKRPYLHLVDGGLSDNLGLRTLLDLSYLSQQDKALPIAVDHHEKIVFISVDAARDIDYSADKTAKIPPITKVIEKAIDNTIDRYSHETVRQFERYLASESNNLPTDVYFIRLNLADLKPSPLRDKIQSISTSFRIEADEIATLQEAVAELLHQSEEYQRLLTDL